MGNSSHSLIFTAILIPLLIYVAVKKRNEIRGSSVGVLGSQSSPMDEEISKLGKRRARLLVFSSLLVALVGYMLAASHTIRTIGIIFFYLGSLSTVISSGLSLCFTVSGKPDWLARK